MKWALTSVIARVFGKKHAFLKVLLTVVGSNQLHEAIYFQ